MRFVHKQSTGRRACATFVLVAAGPWRRRSKPWPKSFKSPSPRQNLQPRHFPQNVEAEAALLGALMIDNRLVEDVQLKLRPHHFFEPLHARIYEAILS